MRALFHCLLRLLGSKRALFWFLSPSEEAVDLSTVPKSADAPTSETHNALAREMARYGITVDDIADLLSADDASDGDEAERQLPSVPRKEPVAPLQVADGSVRRGDGAPIGHAILRDGTRRALVSGGLGVG